MFANVSSTGMLIHNLQPKRTQSIVNYLSLLLFKDNSGPANLTNNTGLHLKKRIKYFMQYDEISQTYKAIYFFVISIST